MTLPTERPPMAGNAATRFFGGPPLMVIFRLVLLCILVGVVLRVLGLDPFNILRSIEDLIRYVWNMGFDAVVWLWRYFLLGAVIVIPIWLIVRLAARAEGAVAQPFVGLLPVPRSVPRARAWPSTGAFHAGFQDPEAGVARPHLLSTLRAGRLPHHHGVHRRRHRLFDHPGGDTSWRSISCSAVQFMEQELLQDVFGSILTVLILLEFNHSIAVSLKQKTGIIQARIVVLIAILVIARKIILLDFKTASIEALAGHAGVALALGALYWLITVSNRHPAAERSGHAHALALTAYSGHASAVIAAASAPTSSSRLAWPPRRSSSAR